MQLYMTGIVALSNLFFRFIARKHREGQANRAQRKLEKLQQGTQGSQATSTTPAPEVQAEPTAPAPEVQAEPNATKELNETTAKSKSKKGGDNDEQ